MKKSLAILLCILSACATNTKIEKKYFDNGNLKEETLYIEDKDVWNKSYYETGKLFSYIDDNIGRIYYPNGQVADEMPLKDGKRHGITKVYNPNGKLKKEISYEKGIKIWQKEYDEDGNKISEKNYERNGIFLSEKYYNKDGKADGIAKIYHRDNGKIFYEIPYKDGKINGIYKLYRKNGNLLSETLYENDKEIWKKEYDEKGNLIKE